MIGIEYILETDWKKMRILLRLVIRNWSMYQIVSTIYGVIHHMHVHYHVTIVLKNKHVFCLIFKKMVGHN